MECVEDKLITSKIEDKASGLGFGICKVCGAKASNQYHYGGRVCEACRSFFRRSVQMKTAYPCHRSCGLVNLSPRKCRACRFQKCLAIGMTKAYFRDKLLAQKNKMSNSPTLVSGNMYKQADPNVGRLKGTYHFNNSTNSNIKHTPAVLHDNTSKRPPEFSKSNYTAENYSSSILRNYLQSAEGNCKTQNYQLRQNKDDDVSISGPDKEAMMCLVQSNSRGNKAEEQITINLTEKYVTSPELKELYPTLQTINRIKAIFDDPLDLSTTTRNLHSKNNH